MNLSLLESGRKAIIKSIKSDRISVILLERGFTTGEMISLLYSDIFKSVRVFEIGQTRFALRSDEYQLIEVELLS